MAILGTPILASPWGWLLVLRGILPARRWRRHEARVVSRAHPPQAAFDFSARSAFAAEDVAEEIAEEEVGLRVRGLLREGQQPQNAGIGNLAGLDRTDKAVRPGRGSILVVEHHGVAVAGARSWRRVGIDRDAVAVQDVVIAP